MNYFNGLTQWMRQILPNRCLLCLQPVEQGHGICSVCLQDGDPGPLCLCCTAPLASNSRLERCGRCLSRKRWRPVQVAYHYRSDPGQLVVQLKARQRWAALTPLCQQLAMRMRQQPLPKALVPIPMDKQRLRQRGCNHALLIANELGKQLQLPVMPQLLVKVKPSQSQHLLNGAERRRNLKHCFMAPQLPPQQGLALVDDIITTGTTMAIAASVLQRQKHQVSGYLALASAMV